MEYGFTRHARRKVHELALTADEVLAIIQRDDVIERYADRQGALLYGMIHRKDIHVSLVRRSEPPITLVTTVYEVDRREFPDGRTRRSTT